MSTLNEAINNTGLTLREIAQQSKISKETIEKYRNGTKHICNLNLANAKRFSNALGISLDELYSLDEPIEKNVDSIDPKERLTNFIYCVEQYRVITKKENHEEAREPQAPNTPIVTMKLGSLHTTTTNLPEGVTIGDLYLKACLLRKVFANDDTSLELVLDDFKKLLSEADITDYQDDIEEISSELQGLHEDQKGHERSDDSYSPEDLYVNTIYEHALHGDISKSRNTHSLPQSIIIFGLAFEIQKMERMLKNVYIDIKEAREKKYIEFEIWPVE